MSAKRHPEYGVERTTTFENYLKRLLVGEDIVFYGWNAPRVDAFNIELEEKTFSIKVKNVHITKTGIHRSAIFFIDDEDNVYRSRCSGIRIVNREREEEYREKMKDVDPYGEEEWGDDLKEEADYRNVTGYGSMGNNDPQNAGPSFNRGPDAATFCRPDVVGLVGDDIEDPYFGDRRRLKMRRIKKNKHIENNRKKKTKYFRDLDRDTLKNKTVEQVVINKQG
jgi:hypothetical protein